MDPQSSWEQGREDKTFAFSLPVENSILLLGIGTEECSYGMENTHNYNAPFV